MSMGYDVFPLREFASFESNLDMLESMGITPLLADGAERNPTLAELRSVIRDSGYTVDSENVEGGNLNIWIRSPDEGGMEIRLVDYSKAPGENASCPLHFEKGTQSLVVTVIERLARLCGSFLVMDEQMNFIIVEPGTEPDASWVEP